MNHKLARQLKDAGFPFRKVEGFLDEGISMKYGVGFQTFDGEETIYLSPTLSELIFAIKDFNQLGKTLNGEWYAQAEGDDVVAYGKTIEESVAKLWLIIQ